MKKLIKFMISGFCLISVSTNAFSALEPIEIELESQPYDEGGTDRPSKGQRMPSAPLTCTIDFENYRIESTIPYEITAYELWYEDGSTLIFSNTSDYAMIEYMLSESGGFQLHLICGCCSYVGFLYL